MKRILQMCSAYWTGRFRLTVLQISYAAAPLRSLPNPIILPMLAPLHTLLGVERKGIGKRTREGRDGNYEKYFINNVGPQRV